MARRKVSKFSLFVGDTSPVEVTLKICKFTDVDKTSKTTVEKIKLEKHKTNHVWEGSVELPDEGSAGGQFFYYYNMRITGPFKTSETCERRLHCIHTHKDIFRGKGIGLELKCRARVDFLEELFADVSTGNRTLDDCLCELEQPDIFHQEMESDSEDACMLRNWLKQKFRSVQEEPALLFLGVVWSKLSSMIDIEGAKVPFDARFVQQMLSQDKLNPCILLPTIKRILHSLIVTLLQRAGKKHWLHMAIEFPKILESVDVGETKNKMSNDVNDISADVFQMLVEVYKTRPDILESIVRELPGFVCVRNENNDVVAVERATQGAEDQVFNDLQGADVNVRLVTNYTNIQTIQLFLVEYVNKDEYQDEKKRPATFFQTRTASDGASKHRRTRDLLSMFEVHHKPYKGGITSARNEWTVASVDLPQNILPKRAKKFEYYFKIEHRKNKKDVTTETKIRKFDRNKKKIRATYLQAEDKKRHDSDEITGRLIHLDQDIFEGVDLTDEATSQTLDDIKSNYKDDIRMPHIKQWVEGKLLESRSLSPQQLLFIIYGMQRMMSSPKTTDKLSAGSSRKLLNVLRTHSIDCFNVSTDLALWLLQSIKGTVVDTIYYFQCHLQVHELIDIGERLHPSFMINETNWSKYEEQLTQMFSSAGEDVNQKNQLLFAHIATKFNSLETLLTFTKLCEDHGLLSADIEDNRVLEKVKSVFKGLLSRAEKRENPVHIAKLLRQGEYANCIPLFQILIECARNYVFNQKWEKASLDEIYRLIIEPNIYQNSNDYFVCFGKLCEQIETEALQHHILLEFLQLLQFNKLDQDQKQAILDCISLFNLKHSYPVLYQSRFCYIYRFSLIHNMCEAIQPTVKHEYNEKVFSVDVEIDSLISCFDTHKSEFSEEELTKVTHHIIRTMTRKKKPPEEQIKEYGEIYRQLEEKHAYEDQKRLIGMQAIDLIGLCAIGADEILSEEVRKWLETILDTKWSWEVVFKANRKEDFMNHDSYKRMIETLRDILSNLGSGKCTFQFVSFIRKRSGDIEKLIRIIEEKQTIVTNRSWLEAKEAALEVVENCRKTVNSMEQFLVLVEYIEDETRMTVGGIRKAKSDVDQIKQLVGDESTYTLTKTEKVTFWDPVNFLLEASSMTSVLANSVTFFNVCCKVIETAGSSSISSIDHLTSKIKECLQIHRECRQNLSSSASTLEIPTITCYLNGIKDVSMLNEEFELLKMEEVSTKSKKALATFLRFQKDRHRIAKIQSALDMFTVSSSQCDIQESLNLMTQLAEDTDDSFVFIPTLGDLVEAMAYFDQLQFKDKDWVILDQLDTCEKLIAFLKPIINAKEDLYNLMEIAIDDNEEQSLHVGIISDLIDVKRLIQSLLQTSGVREFASVIQENRGIAEKLAKKIQTCTSNVNALETLYARMADRGERMRDIVTNALKSITFRFNLRKDDVAYFTSVHFGDIEKEFSHDELHDYKSRALFVVNSKRTLPFDDLRRSDYEYFIYVITVANEINDILNRLNDAGHFDYAVEKTVTLRQEKRDDSLDRLLGILTLEYNTWLETLQNARAMYYRLNFFSSKQLWMLEQLFRKNRNMTFTTEQLLAHLNVFTLDMPSTSESDVVAGRISKQTYAENLMERVSKIGKTIMEHVFIKADDSNDRSKEVGVDPFVKPGQVFVVEHDTAVYPVQVLLQVYKNTYGCDPQLSRWQVLFCHHDTAIEDVELLLNRCEKAYANGLHGVLFSLVNVDQLSHEAQIDVVDRVEHLNEKNKHFLLAIISSQASDRPSSYIVSHFVPKYTHNVNGLDVDDVANWLQKDWSIFDLVSSDAPGLGKTEYIRQLAAKRKKGVMKIPISGSITRTSLVKQLCKHRVHAERVLHLDLGMVSDTSLMDTLLMELILLRTVISGIYVFRLETPFLCLEIANTVNNKLQKSIKASRYLHEHRISWRNFDNYVVCRESQSPVQIVCRYLQALPEEIDKTDIALKTEEEATVEDNIYLEEHVCRKILKAEFRRNTQSIMTFDKIDMYLNIFAEELRKLSESSFLKVDVIKKRLPPGTEANVRSEFVRALNKISKTFGSLEECQTAPSHSITADRSIPVDTTDGEDENTEDTDMIKRTQQMTKWENNKHIMLVFNRQNPETVSLLYRSVEDVPKSIQDVLKVARLADRPSLQNYHDMTEIQLRGVLERVCCTKVPRSGRSMAQYVLTPDNLLKMILIYKRVEAQIPVILMGHTGCGKTLLIRYLAHTCGAPLHVLNIHAGTTMGDISQFMDERKREAQEIKNTSSNTIWIFFDEINTCGHLGVLGDIILNNTFRGEFLPTNLVFLAACNPYIRRERSVQLTAGGLRGKYQADEKSQLVYRVEDMPERILQYVWDFGALQTTDEEKYIQSMLKVHQLTYDYDELDDEVLRIERINKEIEVLQRLDGLFASLVFKSQHFIREVEGTEHCVSLRDVRRCKDLALFFIQWQLKKYPDIADKKTSLTVNKAPTYTDELVIRAIILALTHCYQTRLLEHTDRKNLVKNVGEILQRQYAYATASYVENVIEAEQIDLLGHMDLPPGIAKNSALKENVFIILVSIIARIPIFVVGNPGCSKSLSLQLIKNNLKGVDSKSEFFKRLPRIFMLSYQGSESSTSEGVSKIFEKAKQQFKKHTIHRTGSRKGKRRPELLDDTDMLPVVLLDEVGLAEISKANPLKVLHSLLEPVEEELKLPVVGLSNWALDAAKMNRAVYLLRPEPTPEDLFQTAKKIRDDIDSSHADTNWLSDDQLSSLANAYSTYTKTQALENFHGLRDYYALVKYISVPPNTAPLDTHERVGDTSLSTILENGLLRNFGGLQRNDTIEMVDSFFGKMNIARESLYKQSVLERIKHNLTDGMARHLMIIIQGGSMLSIVDKILKHMQDREYIMILGSQFEDDLSEEYAYSVLSDIILCMEKGETIVLKDLDSIYGSLYDMLNQNYTMIGGKRNCRISLGPHKSPWCPVHDNFKCIVLIDEDKLLIDENKLLKPNPPFLNRFEKQMLNFADVLSHEQLGVVNKLEKWISNLQSQQTKADTQSSEEGKQDRSLLTEDGPSSLQSHDQHQRDISLRDACEIFFGFNDTNLASVVFHLGRKIDNSEELLQRCKEELMITACPSAVLRSAESRLAVDKPQEIEDLTSAYFEMPTQSGLTHFVKAKRTALEVADDKYLRLFMQPMTVVYTLSGVRDNLEALFNVCPTQLVKLWEITSERHLKTQLRHFWESEDELLVLQCMPIIDGNNMQLSRHLLETSHSQHLKNPQGRKPKQVCFLVHLSRPRIGDEDQKWYFGYMPDWNQVTIDCITPSYPGVAGIYSLPLSGIIDYIEDDEFRKLINKELTWCVSCLKYRSTYRAIEDSLQHYGRVTESLLNNGLLKAQIVQAATEQDKLSGSWLVHVACDKNLLHTYGTLDNATKVSIRDCIRSSLGKIIYYLEKYCAWSGIDSDDKDEQLFWKHCFQKMFDICSPSIPAPQGPNSCLISTTDHYRHFPFFMVFHEKIEQCKGRFREQYRRSQKDGSHDIMDAAYLAQMIRNESPEIEYNGFLEAHVDKFVRGIYHVLVSGYHFSSDELIDGILDIVEWYFNSKPSTLRDADAVIRIASLFIELWTDEDRISTDLHLLYMYKQFSHNPRSSNNLQNRIQAIEKQLEQPNYEEDGIEKDDDRQHGKVASTNVLEHVMQAVCELALPTKDVLDIVGGVQEWQQRVGLIIHYAENFQCTDGVKPCVFHFLQVCRDFVTIIGNYFGVDKETVTKLADFGLQLKDSIAGERIEKEELDSPVAIADEAIGSQELNDESIVSDEFDETAARVFEFVQDQIQQRCSSKSLGQKGLEMLEDFLGMYFWRGFAANPDDCAMPEILRRLSWSGDGKPISTASRLLSTIIKTDVALFKDDDDIAITIRDTITNEIPEQYVNFRHIDTFLSNITPDHHIAVMCCDLIEKEVFSNMMVTILPAVNVSNILEPAVTLILTSSKWSLGLLFAIGFVSGFSKSVTTFILEHGIDAFVDKNAALVDQLNGMLGSQQKGNPDELISGRLEALRVFFLKVSYGQLSYWDLQHLCQHLSRVIPALRHLSWQSKTVQTCGIFSPMNYVRSYDDVSEAIQEWPMPANNAKVINIMDKVKSQGACSLALLAVAVDEFFIVKHYRSLTYTEMDQARWLTGWLKEHVTKYDQLRKEYQSLLRHILDDDCSPCFTEPTDASSKRKFYQSLVFIHLASIFVSHRISGGSYSDCLFREHDISKVLLPTIGDPTDVLTDERIMPTSCKSKICPSCRNLIIIYSKEYRNTENNCPVCSTCWENKPLPVVNPTNQSLEHRPGYHRRSGDNTKISLSIRKLTPVAYRTLSLCLHGAFQMALIMNEKKITKLSFLVDRNQDETSSSYKQRVETFLQNRIREDWGVLEELLGLGSENTGIFLHSFIQQNSDILLAKSFDKTFEEAVSRHLDEATDTKVNNPSDLCRLFKRSAQKGNKPLPRMQQQLEEIDEATNHPHLSRLFRKKSSGTFQSLKSSVVNNVHCTTFVQDHSFLCLFISMKDHLECIRHITSLLDWYLLVNDTLNHRIDRIAAKKTIKTFLESDAFVSSDKERETNRTLFAKFQKSWNTIRTKWGLLAREDPDFDEMNDGQQLSTCLEDNARTIGQVQRMVAVLLNIQNDFLEKTACIAASGRCPTFNFLLNRAGIATLPTIPLIEAGKRIIDFVWEDEYLTHSYPDTEYGRGNIIRYNYTALERQLCDVLVLNKAYLTMEHTFIKFTFSSYDAFESIQEISSLIPQEELPVDIAGNVANFKNEENKKVMEQLEVATSFLKRSHSDVKNDAEKPKDQNLLEFFQSVVELIPEDCYAKYCASVKFSHIESLYKKLEENAANVVMKALPPQFNTRLASDENLEKASDQNLEKTFKFNITMREARKGLQPTLSVIKLFMHRYLRQVDALEHIDTPLTELIKQKAKEIHLEDKDVVAAVAVLLPEIKLCQVVDIVSILQTEIDTKKHQTKRDNRPKPGNQKKSKTPRRTAVK